MGKRTFAVAALALAFCTALGFNGTARAAEPVGAQWNMPWDQPPAEFKEMEKRGFHDGVQGAMKDYDHHRFPDVDRRVPPSARGREPSRGLPPGLPPRLRRRHETLDGYKQSSLLSIQYFSVVLT
jgi:hypothetical protein